MRYSASHKAEIRQQLIEKAGALAKKDGFATTGVDGLMSTVGLTGGAFYSHFESKNALLLEIIRRELAVSHKLLSQQLSDGQLQQFLAMYLSPLHVKFPELGCALPALTNEVSRADEAIKNAFEQGIKKTHAILMTQLQDDDTAWAMLAMTVGAVSLARALHSTETQNQLLAACQDFALKTAPKE